jgi:ABC-type polysaccharide/polyol phosphate export permease
MYNGKMIIKQKNTLFLGVFLLVTWIFLGIPDSWKIFFTLVSALYLIIISIKVTLPKRNPSRRFRRKERATPVFMENSPLSSSQSPTTPDQTNIDDKTKSQ